MKTATTNTKKFRGCAGGVRWRITCETFQLEAGQVIAETVVNACAAQVLTHTAHFTLDELAREISGTLYDGLADRGFMVAVKLERNGEASKAETCWDGDDDEDAASDDLPEVACVIPAVGSYVRVLRGMYAGRMGRVVGISGNAVAVRVRENNNQHRWVYNAHDLDDRCDEGCWQVGVDITTNPDEDPDIDQLDPDDYVKFRWNRLCARVAGAAKVHDVQIGVSAVEALFGPAGR